MKISSLLLIYSVFILSQLSACTSLEDSRKAYPEWVKNWINQKACAAPCWENITPGETTYYDINDKTVDTGNELIFNGSVPIVIVTDNVWTGVGQSFSWSLQWGDSTRQSVIVNTISQENLTIGEISFQFFSSFGGPYISDIVNTIGEPEFIGVFTSGPVPSCEAVMLYPDKFVWIELEAKKMKDYYSVDAETSLGRSYFMVETVYTNKKNSFFKTPDQIQKWHGYGDYQCENNLK
jgi:hypothetical protein